MNSFTQTVLNDFTTALSGLDEFANVDVTSAWVPNIDRQAIETTRVIVSPLARRPTLISRSCIRSAVDVSVAIMRPLYSPVHPPVTEQEMMDDDISNVQLLCDAVMPLLGHRIGGTHNMAVTAIEQVVQPPEWWREHRLVASFLTVTLEQ